MLFDHTFVDLAERGVSHSPKTQWVTWLLSAEITNELADQVRPTGGEITGVGWVRPSDCESIDPDVVSLLNGVQEGNSGRPAGT